MNRKSGSIGSRSRRSSILKIDLNRDDETTGILFNKSRGQSRRVSFAETAQIKEFVRDSPRVWRHNSDSNDEENDKENEPCKNKAGGVSITGLDSLLNGEIEAQSYQAIVNCPIQEMSAESFHFCDGNKTVLDQVDMESTVCVESDIGFSPFDPEPSMEIKFEASSFLASLKSKAESMSPMQIYRSPKENNVRSRSFQGSVMDAAENLPPVMMESFTEEPQIKLIDSKSFLSGWMNTQDVCPSEIDMEQEDVEETFCYGSVIPRQAVAESYNGEFLVNSALKSSLEDNKTILGDVGSVEETACIGGILGQANKSQLKMNITQKSDVNQTIHFDENDQMEETKCQGMILNSTSANQTMAENIVSTSDIAQMAYNTGRNGMSGDKTVIGDGIVEVEETACIGGILSNVDKENMIPLGFNLPTYMESDRTQYLGEGMEETQCVGNILKSGFTTPNRTGAVLKDWSDEEKTIHFADQSVHMDETECHGQLEPSKIYRNENAQMGPRDRTIYFTDNENVTSGGMETTTCIGGILTEDEVSYSDPKERNMNEASTQDRKTSAMDETATDKGNYQLSSNKTLNNRDSIQQSIESNIDKTKYFTEDNMAATIEETKCIGGILKESEEAFKPLSGTLNGTKYLNDLDGMEETNCINGSIKTSVDDINNEATGNEHSVQNIPESQYITDKGVESSGSTGKEQSEIASLGFPPSNKTFIGDLTMEETKSVGGIVKNKVSAQGIPERNLTVVGNVTMEGTKTVGGILENKTLVNELNTERNQTVIGNITMEETKSIGGILKNRMELNEVNISPAGDFNMDTSKTNMGLSYTQADRSSVHNENSSSLRTSDFQIEDPNKDECPELDQTCSDEIKLNRTQDLVDTDKQCQQIMPDLTDTEITFKTANKRTLSEIQTKETGNERTRELTSSMKKIKEMLIMSAQKTSQNRKAGTNKTPSKQSTNGLSTAVTHSPTMSPVHKRKRLFNAVSAEKTGNSDDLGDRSLAEEIGITNKESLLGIDDETMPDCMQTELLSSTMGVGETQTDTAFYPNTTLRANDSQTTSSGNTCNLSTLSNMSMMKPFVAPDGPMSLETFFKLTAKPLSCIKGDARYSILPAPRIDYDCKDEVIEAEVVDGPLVVAKNKLYDRMKERHRKNEENIVWLQKTLEETQPQLFQDVAKGDPAVIKEITDKMYVMFSCCRKDANTVWKEETKQMYGETAESVEVEGHQKIECLLGRVRKQTEAEEQLLCSLDNDMEAFDNLEAQLRESEEKKHLCESELNIVVKDLKKFEELESKLKSRNEASHNGYMLQEARTTLRRRIREQLVLTEWNLEEFEDDYMCFTFLENEVQIRIDFDASLKEKLITNMDVQSCIKPGCRWLHKEVAHSLFLAAIDKEDLLNKYTDFSSLPKMLQEISTIAIEIGAISHDIKEVNREYKLVWDGKTLSFEMWNIKELRMAKLYVTFSHGHHSSTVKLPVNVQFEHLMGDVRVPEIEKCLLEVNPKSKFLQNLVQTINTRLSLKTISDSLS